MWKTIETTIVGGKLVVFLYLFGQRNTLAVKFQEKGETILYLFILKYFQHLVVVSLEHLNLLGAPVSHGKLLRNISINY